MKRSLFTILVFTKLNTKRFFRDKLAIFFTVLFPLIFVFVFGGIFGKDSGVSFKVAVINQSDSQFAKQFASDIGKQKVFKVDKEATTLPKAHEKMDKSQIDGTIVLPKNFGQIKPGQAYPSGQAEVLFTQNNEQSGQTLTSILEAQFKGLNAKYVEAPTPFVAVPKRISDKSLSQFDYTFAGLLGFSIIGLGIFGPINVFPELKKQGILRRLHTTPLRVWEYFVSTVITQTVVGLISMIALFAVAIGVFDLKIVGNWFELVAFIALGIISILGIGLALGGWAKNERQVAPLANIIVFPMMFLSGTFFPRFLMPEWLQSVSAWLPLTPIIDGIRLIATEGKTLIDIAPQVGMTAGWLLVVYIIAFRVFRWE